MWLALIVALLLELLKKTETFITTIKYITVSVILTLILGFIMAYITPTEAAEIIWYLYLFISGIYAVLGVIIGKILRWVAGAK